MGIYFCLFYLGFNSIFEQNQMLSIININKFPTAH